MGEIESENLYLALITVDRRTLQIVLLKMQGYSTKEIAPLVHLTAGAIYARIQHPRKKLKDFKQYRANFNFFKDYRVRDIFSHFIIHSRRILAYCSDYFKDVRSISWR